jgi:hypothetical protein
MKTQIKLFLLLVSFSLLHFSVNAQTFNGTDIRNTALDLIPEVDLQNKILFINVWQSASIESRENNKEFLRVSDIYHKAKLKNGSQGVVFINICLDNDLYTWILSTKRDSITSKYNLENTTQKYKPLLNYFDHKPGSLVIGNDGTIISKDLKKEDCFKLFLSLITR